MCNRENIQRFVTELKTTASMQTTKRLACWDKPAYCALGICGKLMGISTEELVKGQLETYDKIKFFLGLTDVSKIIWLNDDALCTFEKIAEHLEREYLS